MRKTYCVIQHWHLVESNNEKCGSTLDEDEVIGANYSKEDAEKIAAWNNKNDSSPYYKFIVKVWR